MKHPIRWILGGVAVLLIGAIALGAWYILGDDAPAKPTLGTCESTGGETVAGSWVVAPGDGVYAGYRMTEVFAGDTVHKTAVGRTPAVEGTMTVTDDAVTEAKVTAQMQQLKSDRMPRDNYIHTNGIESDDFPTAMFELTDDVAIPNGLAKCDPVRADAVGKLTLHGVTNEVTVPIEAIWKGDTIAVVGNAPVHLADYDIDPPETSVVKVDGDGSFELSLTFVPATP